MKTRIQTASPKRTRRRLKEAGLDPDRYEIGPLPGDFNDETLGELIRRDGKPWNFHGFPNPYEGRNDNYSKGCCGQ